MPVTANHPAPYAPASAVLGLVERHRNKGLPAPVNADVLERASISSSLVPRTLQALQALDLIDGDGKPTPVLEGIRVAPQAEYQQRLADWLTGAYADALQYVDPATDDEVKVRDAFRSYLPIGQQPRMVSLFLALFAAAGIRSEKPRQSQRKPAAPGAPKAPRQSAQKTSARTAPPPPPPARSSSLPPALSGLLASLPANGQNWQKAERDRFVATFGAVLDFCFPVEGPRKAKPSQDEMRDVETD